MENEWVLWVLCIQPRIYIPGMSLKNKVWGEHQSREKEIFTHLDLRNNQLENS